MSIPPKDETRIKIKRSYDIYQDQVDWLDNSSLNKAKKIRELLDDFINQTTETILQNLRDEITSLNKIRETKNLEISEYDDQLRELMETIESQKSVIVAQKEAIVAMGGEE